MKVTLRGVAHTTTMQSEPSLIFWMHQDVSKVEMGPQQLNSYHNMLILHQGVSKVEMGPQQLNSYHNMLILGQELKFGPFLAILMQLFGNELF